MKSFARLLIAFLISFTLIELPATKAQAGMIGTSEVVGTMSRTATEARVANFLSQEEVQKQMEKLGVNAEEAKARLATLSDRELQEMNQQIEQATVAGDVGGILVVVLLVILIIYFAKRI